MRGNLLLVGSLTLIEDAESQIIIFLIEGKIDHSLVVRTYLEMKTLSVFITFTAPAPRAV